MKKKGTSHRGENFKGKEQNETTGKEKGDESRIKLMRNGKKNGKKGNTEIKAMSRSFLTIKRVGMSLYVNRHFFFLETILVCLKGESHEL